MNYSANYSALYAIAVILIIGFAFRIRGQRLNLKKVLEALEGGAKDLLAVAMACAVAGLMIGVLTKTGLGLKFTSLFLSISGGLVLPTMILTMICCIILGMGLPTTAAFIITATLCAPALIQLGITALGAYMFVFYYACLSAITPGGSGRLCRLWTLWRQTNGNRILCYPTGIGRFSDPLLFLFHTSNAFPRKPSGNYPGVHHLFDRHLFPCRWSGRLYVSQIKYFGTLHPYCQRSFNGRRRRHN